MTLLSAVMATPEGVENRAASPSPSTRPDALQAQGDTRGQGLGVRVSVGFRVEVI